MIKEVCRKPPRDLIQLNDKVDIKKELLYIILDYFIILNEKEIFEKLENGVCCCCFKYISIYRDRDDGDYITTYERDKYENNNNNKRGPVKVN